LKLSRDDGCIQTAVLENNPDFLGFGFVKYFPKLKKDQEKLTLYDVMDICIVCSDGTVPAFQAQAPKPDPAFETFGCDWLTNSCHGTLRTSDFRIPKNNPGSNG